MGQRLAPWIPLLVLLLLAAWHGVLTLRLFGGNAAEIVTGLTDERPVVAGRHALHGHWGRLGTVRGKDRLSVVGYEPAFLAGCPQTPWFDSGSRPAEVFATVADCQAAYKIGLALSWALLPFLAWLGAAALGWEGKGRNAALTLALILCWSPWGRERLWAGDLALLLSTGSFLLALCLLSRFHDAPTWKCGLALAGTLGLTLFWLPFMLVCLLPVLVLFYSFTGSHRPWRWHLALGVVAGGACVLNGPWLHALLETWWLLGERTLPPAGLSARLWPWSPTALTLTMPARLLLGLLLAGGASGLVLLRRGASGSLFPLLAALCVAWAWAMLGPLWEGCSPVEPEKFLFTTLFLAVLPTVQSLGVLHNLLARWVTLRWRWLGAVSLLLLLEWGLGLHRDVREFLRESWRAPRLPLGLSSEQEACLEELRTKTTPAARILWEDTARTDAWSPLLPTQTQRSYLGGLGQGGPVEHLRLRWANGMLAGKSLPEWTETEVNGFCTRYNIGWVVSQSPKGTHFWQEQPLARFVGVLPGGLHLFALQRPPSFFLQGKGRIIHCDRQRITLEDVEPEQGILLLSFHHHDRMRSTDHRVQLEPARGVDGELPLLRLRVAGPVSRVTIQW
jgi:hypothetical protein